ncbi:GumC family protein [Methylobacterium brachythecii]|uniref:Succinoglycan biosynthesis transport protein ExoP n=2 Tax=Methylobacterium brachythecii TaxID=1176177 RepID=A0ABQ6D213_9HYPH|nr:GNVR domain-containing protein [Methylobacterium brachythecii]GLS42670.1 succinoglycan biosynthesis transport protein ExoP [Methylobacterium brachythecii]
MLRLNPAWSPDAQNDAPTRRAVFSLGAIGTALRRSLWTVVGAMVLCVAAAAVFCVFSTPTYVANVQLLIEPQKQQQLLLFEPGMLDLTLDNAQVESQVEVLRSERLAAWVVKDLKLATDPEFQADPSRMNAHPGAGSSGDADRDEAQRLRTTVANLAKHVGVRRIGQSYVIEISAWSTRADLAAQIANAYASAYLRDQFDAKSQGARQGVDWLKLRITELRGTLNNAARAVEDFKSKNGLVTAGTNLLVEQQLSEMNTELVSARAQTTQSAARLARVRAVGGAAAGSASVGEALNNQVITNLRERQQNAIAKEAEFRDRYGPTHESVVKAQADAAQAETEIATEMQRIAQTYLSDYEIAVERERALEGEVGKLVAVVDKRRQSKVVLSEMEAQAESYRKMYQNLLEKLTETSQKETLPISNARIVAPANAPLGKSSPKTGLILALGAAFGLLGGTVYATVRVGLDRTVRTAEDVSHATRLDCLGLMPFIAGKRSGGKGGKVARPIGFEVLEAPFSAFSRALRRTKIAIDASRESRTMTTIGIVSTASGEGKTSIALNLGALYAQAHLRTLLVDADFRKADLTRANAPMATAGLVEVLESDADAIQSTRLPNLDLLPLVFTMPIAQSSDILSSRQASVLLAALSTSYDIVILDLAAMQDSADVRAVGRLLDGLLLVAAWGETEAAVLSEATHALDASGAHVFGVVLNKIRDTASVSQSI